MGNLVPAGYLNPLKATKKTDVDAFGPDAATWKDQSPISVFDEMCGGTSGELSEAILRLDFLSECHQEIRPFGRYICGSFGKQVKLALLLARTLLEKIPSNECVSFCVEDMPDALLAVKGTTLAWGQSEAITTSCATVFIMPCFHPSSEMFEAPAPEESAIIWCVVQHVWRYYANFWGLYLAMDSEKYAPLFASRSLAQLAEAIRLAHRPDAVCIN